MEITEKTGQGQERIDELQAIMAGLEEPALTRPAESTQVHPIAQRIMDRAATEAAYEAINEFVAAMEKLTTREQDDKTREHFAGIWTDAIVLAGDLRRTAGL